MSPQLQRGDDQPQHKWGRACAGDGGKAPVFEEVREVS
jgi:hypothetical protein